MECTRWHTNQQAYLEVIWKENKTDDVICLHFGVYGNICGHMIPSSAVLFYNSTTEDYCFFMIYVDTVFRRLFFNGRFKWKSKYRN